MLFCLENELVSPCERTCFQMTAGVRRAKAKEIQGKSTPSPGSSKMAPTPARRGNKMNLELVLGPQTPIFFESSDGVCYGEITQMT